MHRELVRRAQAGDHEAFAALARGSFARAYGVARLILRDNDRAEDAVQEAFVQAWKHVRAIRDPDAWDSWLNRLVVRACYREGRQTSRRNLVELHVVPDREPPSAGDMTMSVANRDQMTRALGRLPIDQRTVMVLHFYLDLPLPEAAEILDIPVGTAKSRLHRGLESLRIAMAADRPRAAAAAGERPV
jgi:RNA polymerase sigma-70 factor, ECF subfamily